LRAAAEVFIDDAPTLAAVSLAPPTSACMTLSPWLPLFLAIPVLLLGEGLVRRVRVLARFNIPAPVVGGLVISLAALMINLVGTGGLAFTTTVKAQWWTWIVTIEPEWVRAPAKSVSFPFMVAFFTCVGLNATWKVVRKGSVQVVIFLGLATLLAALQNGIGIGIARALGVNPLLGIVCGSATMTGGHGTALGFADVFTKLGLENAAVLGAAAATAGLVTGGLLGGPVGGYLIRRRHLKPTSNSTAAVPVTHMREEGTGILQDFRLGRRLGWTVFTHVLLVLGCLKAGAWVSYFLVQATGKSFSAQIGAMIVGVVLRNVLDLAGKPWIRSEVVDLIGSVSLGVFLAVAMMALNLVELANTALPMLAILAVQVAMMAVFAIYLTYPVMGRDHDAAVMAAGHCGFGLGATPNAIANMKSLVDRYGAAPRAFLVIPLVGAILIDFTNALVITFFLDVAK
jgi:glutamate:Na+ symporter, ESS family